MVEKQDFLETLRRFVDEQDGFILVNELRSHFSGRSRSYVNVCLNSLEKKGLVERLNRNAWRLIEPTSAEATDADIVEAGPEAVETEIVVTSTSLRPLILTPEERIVFDLLTEVKTKCTDKNNGPRFAEDEVRAILQSKKLALTEWISLKDKLFNLGIICPKGKGLKGFIYELNEDLLLDYLTGDNLVKETLWREEKVRENLQTTMGKVRNEALQISEIEEDISRRTQELELARLEVRRIEDDLLRLKTRLETDFPDKDKILAFKELLSSMEHLGEEDTLQFIKSVLGV